MIGVSVFGMVLIFLFATYPMEGYRAARELESRGYGIIYARQGYTVWQHPIRVIGFDQRITADDSRLICRLSRLQALQFVDCDISDLNLDEIGNCQELNTFWFRAVTQTPFPMSEIQKLTACPSLKHLHLDCNYGELSDDKTVDACLEYLAKMPALKILKLPPSNVTKEGIEEFRKKHPDIEVEIANCYITAYPRVNPGIIDISSFQDRRMAVTA